MPALSAEIRNALSDAAVRLARACSYESTGTVEFLYDNSSFYFLEMNARLQVEHPVTELVTGLDLVELQLRIAEGEPLPEAVLSSGPVGHAIECRMNAEDPTAGAFTPSPGRIERLVWPSGPGVRVDPGYAAGDTVSDRFDNLVAKIIAFGSDREQARRRMLRALGETVVEGVATTIPALRAIVGSDAFSTARHWTRFVEEDLDFSDIVTPPVDGTVDEDGRVLETVETELDGRHHVVRLWMPPVPSAGSPKAARRRGGVVVSTDGSATTLHGDPSCNCSLRRATPSLPATSSVYWRR